MTKPLRPTAAVRVSEALKSDLEKQLFDEKDALVLTGHESKVVSQDYSTEREIAAADVHWNDERFSGFLHRLGALDLKH